MAGALNQQLTPRWAVYNADCMDVMGSLPDGSIHLSVYSPPFAGLYHYSSDDRDLSNARNYEEFAQHYGYVIDELTRVTMPGRITAVHAATVPLSNNGRDAMRDFPGDVIRWHQARGWDWCQRHAIWKEPLAVRLRTMQKNLAHQTIVEDSSRAGNAAADELLIFRKRGDNPVPITHPVGLLEYAGEREIPADVIKYKGWAGKQTENRYSHWIWRQYASSFWDDIRLGHVLPFRDARSEDDEKHVHPLQLDVIHRAVQLYSNMGERVLTPFAGVGSEVYEAVRMGRIGIGAELKESYFAQLLLNLAAVDTDYTEEPSLFDDLAMS